MTKKSKIFGLRYLERKEMKKVVGSAKRPPVVKIEKTNGSGGIDIVCCDE